MGTQIGATSDSSAWLASVGRDPATQPLVSIIVNVFNGARYVRECLDSILALEGGFPVQVLVIDDCSSDATVSILADYKQPEIQVVRLESNQGAAAAINHAFSLVRGEFVARIDYDDRYCPAFLVEGVAALDRHPEAAFVCSAAMMIDPEGKPTTRTGPDEYGEETGCHDRFRAMLTRHFVTAPTILGRTSHWRRAIPIPTGMNFCDWYMNLIMAEKAPVVVLDVITADYRVHPLGMHATKVRDGMGERITREVLQRFLVDTPRHVELAPYALGIRAGHAADWGNKYFGAGMDADALRCYREAVGLSPDLFLRGKFAHRMLGLMAGRTIYERIKRLLVG